MANEKRYLSIILRLADNAESRLVLDAADRLPGATVSAVSHGHLMDECDAALAQVGVKAELISAIAFASAKKWGVPAQEFFEQFQPWAQNLCRHHIANNTSATAQQFVEKVRREALEEAAIRALALYSRERGAVTPQSIEDAILGEKP